MGDGLKRVAKRHGGITVKANSNTIKYNRDGQAKFYQCGICDCFHSAAWNGDCREDKARYAMDELDAMFGPLGWVVVDMP